MASFIDKLKNINQDKKSEKISGLEAKPEKQIPKDQKFIEMKSVPLDEETEERIELKTEKEKPKKEEKIKISDESTNSKEEPLFQEELLNEEEGQLAVDIYQTDKDLVIQSAVAGVNVHGIDISLENDILSIRGTRRKTEREKGDYFSQECFWGSFSREIILPVEVDPERVQAKMKDGILTIRIPKIIREQKRKITVSA